MWTRWRCRRCYNNIPPRLRGKYRQAVAAKSGEGSTGSSTSSGEEDKKDAEIKELLAQIELYRKQTGGEEQGGQGLPPRRETGLIEASVQRVQREVGAFQEQMPGREDGRKNSEDEQDQGKTSQQLVLPAPARFNEGTPVSLVELDLPRARGAQGIQVQRRVEKDLCPIPQVDFRWKRMYSWGNCEWRWDERAFSQKGKRRKKQPG